MTFEPHDVVLHQGKRAVVFYSKKYRRYGKESEVVFAQFEGENFLTPAMHPDCFEKIEGWRGNWWLSNPNPLVSDGRRTYATFFEVSYAQ